MKTTTLKIIDRLRELTETGSDYAVANLLNIKKQGIVNYKKGGQFDNTTALKAAELLHIDYTMLIARIEVERETDPVKHAIWKKYLQRLSVAASITLFAAVTFSGMKSELTYQDYHANTESNIFFEMPEYTLCA